MTYKYTLKAIFLMTLCVLLPIIAHSQSKGLGLTTVVIDPGHGGKDPGALGQTSSTHEKHIVLAVSKLLGEKIENAYPDVKVVYTRSSDKFIGLHERAMVARNNNANLFISIHCNSNNSKSAKGSSVHILGQRSERKTNTTDYFERNKSVAQRENEVIVMEDGYETKYTHFDPNTPEAYIGYTLQWKAHYESSLLFAAEVVDKLMVKPLAPRQIAIDQDIFQVLVEANMPAVLLEIAFISNPTEYKYLASKNGQEEIAERLFQAFKSYKTQYDMSMNVPVQETEKLEVEPADVQKTEQVEAGGLYYAVQIMSSGKLLKAGDSEFKGFDARAYKPEGAKVYKYIIGKYKTREDAAKALPEIKKKFPQAFIIEVQTK